MPKPILAALALSFAVVAAALPAAAQSVITVPANASWKHAGTGVILRSRIAGLPRGEIRDSSASELDVVVQYGDPQSLAVTLYLYRTALISVPVWFDRSEAQILLRREVFGSSAPVDAPTAFAPPRGTAASALRRIYVPGRGPFKSTGLAMLPLGDWLVAVRISASGLDPAALDAKLGEVIAGIVWPTGIAESAAATPVAPCTTPIAFAKAARLEKPDITQALLGATIVGLGEDEKLKDAQRGAAPRWCREGVPAQMYGVYRADESSTGYAMAVGDAGRVIYVQPGLALDDKRKAPVSLSLADLDRTLIYPSFDKLPTPETAFEAVRKTSPVSATARGGKNITISM